MARISYVEEKDRPELSGLMTKIKGVRGALLHIYKLLLHSPQLAATWYEHVSAARWGTKLSGRLREIVIIRVGKINDIPYVMKQHVPALAEAEGLSRGECDALADWRAAACFSAAERAVPRDQRSMTSTAKMNSIRMADRRASRTLILPAATGLFAVRFILASVSFSTIWLMAFAAPVTSIPPAKSKRTERMSNAVSGTIR